MRLSHNRYNICIVSLGPYLALRIVRLRGQQSCKLNDNVINRQNAYNSIQGRQTGGGVGSGRNPPPPEFWKEGGLNFF